MLSLKSTTSSDNAGSKLWIDSSQCKKVRCYSTLITKCCSFRLASLNLKKFIKVRRLLNLRPKRLRLIYCWSSSNSVRKLLVNTIKCLAEMLPVENTIVSRIRRRKFQTLQSRTRNGSTLSWTILKAKIL
jgi:hypothetical protein